MVIFNSFLYVYQRVCSRDVFALLMLGNSKHLAGALSFQALARFCVVFNCSDELDVNAMAPWQRGLGKVQESSLDRGKSRGRSWKSSIEPRNLSQGPTLNLIRNQTGDPIGHIYNR